MTSVCTTKKLLFISLICCLALLTSLVVQYKIGIPLCALCLTQRTLYCLILLTSLLTILPIKQKKWLMLSVKTCIVLLAVTSLIHLATIYNLLPDFCERSKIVVQSPDAYFAMVQNSMSCKKSVWKFLGIPVAFYNVVISIGMLAMLNAQNSLRASSKE